MTSGSVIYIRINFGELKEAGEEFPKVTGTEASGTYMPNSSQYICCVYIYIYIYKDFVDIMIASMLINALPTCT